MQVKLDVKKETKTFEVDEGAIVEEVLKKAGINKHTVIVKRKGKIICKKEKLHPGEKIRLIKIVQGG